MVEQLLLLSQLIFRLIQRIDSLRKKEMSFETKDA